MNHFCLFMRQGFIMEPQLARYWLYEPDCLQVHKSPPSSVCWVLELQACIPKTWLSLDIWSVQFSSYHHSLTQNLLESWTETPNQMSTSYSVLPLPATKVPLSPPSFGISLAPGILHLLASPSARDPLAFRIIKTLVSPSLWYSLSPSIPLPPHGIPLLLEVCRPWGMKPEITAGNKQNKEDLSVPTRVAEAGSRAGGHELEVRSRARGWVVEAGSGAGGQSGWGWEQGGPVHSFPVEWL